MFPGPRNEGADHGAYNKKGSEGDKILRIRDHKGQHGRDKEKVKGKDAEKRGSKGRTEPVPQRGKHHSQQIKHHEVCRRKKPACHLSQESGGRDKREALHIIAPDPFTRRYAFGSLSFL